MAALVEALIAGDAVNGRVRLPAPFEHHRISLATFDPARDFAASHGETTAL